MKKTLPLLVCLFCALFMLSCSKSDSGGEGTGVTKYDGKYKGNSFIDNQVLGSWEMNITNGNISGEYVQGGEVSALSGSVSESGAMNISFKDDEGTQVTINAVVQNGKITGTWSNGEGQSGTIEGEKEDDGNNSNELDGSYSGIATLNGTNAANWNFVIIQNKISGTFTDMTGTAFIIGNANSNGASSIEIVYDNGAIVNAALQISGGNVSGTWNADGNSGDITGKKDNNNTSNNYDGSYEGQAFMDGEGIGSWTMIIKNNVAEGSYSGEEASGSVKGIVTATGSIKFNAYFPEEDYVVNVKATITGNKVTGTWNDNEGDSGTLSGNKK